MFATMPPVVRDFVIRLSGRGCRIWLIGSRANETARADSDWDLLVFSDKDKDKEIMQTLEGEEPTPGIDLLVVYEEDRFRSPWFKAGDGKFKGGSLTDWNWFETSDREATYKGTKWPNDWGGTSKRAVRFLP